MQKERNKLEKIESIVMEETILDVFTIKIVLHCSSIICLWF